MQSRRDGASAFFVSAYLRTHEHYPADNHHFISLQGLIHF